MASPPPWKVVFLCLVLSLSPFICSIHHAADAAAAAVNFRSQEHLDRTDHQILPRKLLTESEQEKKKADNEDEAVLSRLLGLPGQLFAGLSWEAAVGEYLVDVLIGTPPVRFSMILDTASDLTWVKCSPSHSSSFRRISRHDARCGLVEALDRKYGPTGTCPYYYSYEGEEQYTTGDLATETFMLNITLVGHSGVGSETVKVENVIFGCGDSNKLGHPFNVASGVLGLGGGPLSFSTQLSQPLYGGHSFSYCLANTNIKNPVLKTNLVLGIDQAEMLISHHGLNFTSFVTGNPNLDITFYYVQIRSIMVGGEALDIPDKTWEISRDGSGGTIIDSGSTVSVFPHEAHEIIKEAFLRKVTRYRVVVEEHDKMFSPCYNVYGLDVERLEMPELRIVFEDGAAWNFPVENYFMGFGDVVCLAILGVKDPRFSIIGNFQQQNFHILFDREEGRLGFAKAKCGDI